MQALTRTAIATQSLSGKIALVTGGARGLGEAICRDLAEAGATVIVADIAAEAARQVAGSLADYNAQALALDITDEAQVEAAIAGLLADRGRIDILINNAGTDYTLAVDELTSAQWDRVLDVNLRGPFLLSHHVLPAMKAQGNGQIVNIVSTAAKRAWANASAYHASKWGLLGFSHALHVEGRSHGIKVTAVVSGGMRTPFLLDRFPDIDTATLQDPANVAQTVRFLLTLPAETVIPEITVLPMRETSWP